MTLIRSMHCICLASIGWMYVPLSTIDIERLKWIAQVMLRLSIYPFSPPSMWAIDRGPSAVSTKIRNASLSGFTFPASYSSGHKSNSVEILILICVWIEVLSKLLAGRLLSIYKFNFLKLLFSSQMQTMISAIQFRYRRDIICPVGSIINVLIKNSLENSCNEK